MTDAAHAPQQRDVVREMLTAEQVLKAIPFSRTTLFRLERDRLFPQGQAITPHRKLWFKDEIVAWQRDVQDPTSALHQAMHERTVKALAQAMEARRLKKEKVKLKAI
jgi:prophage regulatory protein